MLIENRTIPTVLFLFFLFSFALLLMSGDERWVAAPVFACVAMVVWLWMSLWHRDQKIPFFDVGMFCALAILIYTVYPLINYWADGLQFGSLGDFRLRSYNISPSELGFFHLRHVLYLFSFVVCYSVFRGKGTMEMGNIISPNSSTKKVILFCFFLLTGYFFLLQAMTGLNYNTSYESDAFGKNVSAFASAPLILIQISSKLSPFLFLFKLALLLIVVSRCKEKKWLMILILWTAFEVFQTVYIKGARTGLILFVMAAGLFFHRIIKPLSMKFLTLTGISIFIFFIFLGFYRSYEDLSYMRANLSNSDSGIFSGNNEFQVLLGTEYDVFQRKSAGAVIPWYLHINDFIDVLPPQQLMPFEKIAARDWYIQEIGMSGTGLGLMWGVITQSIIGLDWLELPIRGAILGFI